MCAVCGHRWPFTRLPLFAVTGPSAGGKSTVGPALARLLCGTAVVLEQDVLWTGGLRDDVDGHPVFRSTWLRMAAMIGQSGRPVVLCGTVAPPEFEPLPERAFFSAIHYLALVADDDVLAARLRARPAWREWDEPRIAEMLSFAGWLRTEAARMDPPVRLVDTTRMSVDAAARAVHDWIADLWPGADHSAQRSPLSGESSHSS